MSLLTPMLRSSPLTDWFSDAQRVQATKPSILPRWARRQWEPVIWPSRW